MATKRTCDLCANEGIDSIEVKSSTTTKIVRDVCELHLAEFKKIMRAFTGQDFAEVVVEDGKVKVNGK